MDSANDLLGTESFGARFAKWRGVIAIAKGLPTDYCIVANAHALARYAALCQEEGIVPIVEPEVLMDGEHDIHLCERVTSQILRKTFEQLAEHRVLLEGVILKPNMVLPGTKSTNPATVAEIAEIYPTVPSKHGAVRRSGHLLSFRRPVSGGGNPKPECHEHDGSASLGTELLVWACVAGTRLEGLGGQRQRMRSLRNTLLRCEPDTMGLHETESTPREWSLRRLPRKSGNDVRARHPPQLRPRGPLHHRA